MFRDSAENGHEKARRVTKSFRVFLRLFVADAGFLGRLSCFVGGDRAEQEGTLIDANLR